MSIEIGEHRGVPYGIQIDLLSNDSRRYTGRIGGARNYGPYTVSLNAQKSEVRARLHAHIDSLAAAGLLQEVEDA